MRIATARFVSVSFICIFGHFVRLFRLNLLFSIDPGVSLFVFVSHKVQFKRFPIYSSFVMSHQDTSFHPTYSDPQSGSDVPSALLHPSPGDYMIGLGERVDRDELPSRAFYLIELVTPALDPSELKALKALVEINDRTRFRLKRAWVPYRDCPSDILPLDVYEQFFPPTLTASVRDTGLLKREAEESSSQLHHSEGGHQKVVRLTHSAATSVSGEGAVPSSITLHPVRDDDDSNVGAASYLSMTFDVESKQFVCRHYYAKPGTRMCCHVDS